MSDLKPHTGNPADELPFIAHNHAKNNTGDIITIFGSVAAAITLALAAYKTHPSQTAKTQSETPPPAQFSK